MSDLRVDLARLLRRGLGGQGVHLGDGDILRATDAILAAYIVTPKPKPLPTARGSVILARTPSCTGPTMLLYLGDGRWLDSDESEPFGTWDHGDLELVHIIFDARAIFAELRDPAKADA